MPAAKGLRADRTVGMMVLAFFPMSRAVRYLPFDLKPEPLPASLDYLFGPVSVTFWGALWAASAVLIVVASAMYRRRLSAVAVLVLSFLCIIWALSMFATAAFFDPADLPATSSPGSLLLTATGYAVTGVLLAAWMRLIIPPIKAAKRASA